MFKPYQSFQLKNNLKVLIFPKPELNSVFLSLWLKAGSINDLLNKIGTAHFVEHLVMEKTDRLSALQLAQAQEMLGGSFGGSVDEEITRIEGTFHRQHASQALQILKEIAFNRHFQKSSFLSARQIIAEEIRMSEDDLFEEASILARQNRFQDKIPLSYSVIGDQKNLKNINFQDTQKFYEHFYQPSNSVLIVIGRIEMGKIRQEVEKIFDSTTDHLVSFQLPAINYSKKKIELKSKELESAHIFMTFPGLSWQNSTTERLILNLMALILGGLNSSRLFEQLRIKNNLIYDINSETIMGDNHGVMSLAWTCHPENFTKTVNLVLAELKKLKNQELGSKELKHFKNYLNQNNDMDFDYVGNISEWLGEDLIRRRSIVLPEEVQKIRAQITAKDVQKMAQRIFNPELINLTALGPIKSQTEIELPEF